MNAFAKKIRIHRRTLGFLGGCLLGFCLWFVPPVIKLKWGTVIVQRWDHHAGHISIRAGVSEENWIPFERFSRHALYAIIVAEDARFYEHNGLDFVEIYLSFIKNWHSAKIMRGASTLTQQVVRMAFLGRERTFLRKFREAAGALILELVMPKNEILTWYANLIDFGHGIYGLKDASRFYFRTRPELLTVNQSIHLALVIPSPNKWSQGLRSHKLTSFGHLRFAKILWEMRANGYISQEQWIQSMNTGDFSNPIHSSKKKTKTKTDPMI
jgi:monofunctional biosynthetic peptidoglycan transglycosylase